MKIQKKRKRIKIFDIVNYIIMICALLTCLLPFMHVLAMSLSSKSLVDAGEVTIFPKGINLKSFNYVITRTQFWNALKVTLSRTVIALVVSMTLLIFTAYPLSRSQGKLKGRKYYVWMIVFTMFFSGGIIPTYMTVKELKMLDTMWVLVLPIALNPFNLVILLNFFRRVPVELEEAARMDGARHFRILWSIFVPVSKPAIATLILFTAVFHWNSWFDGLIYMNQSNYPLQTYLRSVIIARDMQSFRTSTLREMELLTSTSNRTLVSAQIIIGSLPIIMFYPFLQKYFMKGITIGAVKG